MIQFRDKHTMAVLKSICVSKLYEGMLTEDVVDVSGFRCIGKTSALVQVAKEKGLGIVVPNQLMVDILRKEYDFKDAYAYYALRNKTDSFRGKRMNLLVDEGVLKSDLKFLEDDYGIKVVGGWHTYSR